jgi:hypothetical protein
LEALFPPKKIRRGGGPYVRRLWYFLHTVAESTSEDVSSLYRSQSPVRVRTNLSSHNISTPSRPRSPRGDCIGTESTSEDLSASCRSRSPVRVRRLTEFDSRSTHNLSSHNISTPSRPRSPNRGIYFCACCTVRLFYWK